ncbi:MAG: hypothetical protein O3C61_01600 [Proteobacteria bacterium]|nr:hypothetical protein [Pseudomonadota bacterium]
MEHAPRSFRYSSLVRILSLYGSLLMGLIGSGKCKNFDELEQYRVESRSFFPTKDERSMSDFTTWKEIIDKHFVNIS